jgi:hypothetical protein
MRIFTICKVVQKLAYFPVENIKTTSCLVAASRGHPRESNRKWFLSVGTVRAGLTYIRKYN